MEPTRFYYYHYVSRSNLVKEASLNNRESHRARQLSAFGYLCLTQQAVKLRLNKASPPVSDNKGWLGLMFLSGHSVLMTPLEEVAGIVPVYGFASIPGVKPWVLGMSSYRGEIFPVTDLNGMLTNTLSPITKDSRILIVSMQDEYSGLMVSRVLGLQRITQQHSVEKLPKGLVEEYFPFVTGSIINERFQLPIISCQSIVRHPWFKDVTIREAGN